MKAKQLLLRDDSDLREKWGGEKFVSSLSLSSSSYRSDIQHNPNCANNIFIIQFE